ncbi:hypothetical protein CN230_12480 [Sinorhizobium meliloti]|nr:hypothetical protein CN230_12480 [Sinorhizobium meliloti]RVG36968.1 hypothetical protein CN225_10770 [Sinorhizobium meliloti]
MQSHAASPLRPARGEKVAGRPDEGRVADYSVVRDDVEGPGLFHAYGGRGNGPAASGVFDSWQPLIPLPRPSPRMTGRRGKPRPRRSPVSG